MSTPNSPEKKKGRQASYVPNEEVSKLERKETAEERVLKQSHLDLFFAGHNDPSEFGTSKPTKQASFTLETHYLDDASLQNPSY
jgi:hypothetical protein